MHIPTLYSYASSRYSLPLPLARAHPLHYLSHLTLPLPSTPKIINSSVYLSPPIWDSVTMICRV